MLSLIKIPFLLCTTALLHVCMTPPNKAPPQKEQYVPRFPGEKRAELVIRQYPIIFGLCKTVHWLITLGECTAILVAAFPRATPSQFVASRLGFDTPDHPFPSHVAHPTPVFILASLVTISACIVRILSFRELGPMFTFELARTKNYRLVTTGPYAIVRHPSYTGFLFATWGIMICLTGRNSWIRESGFMETTAGTLVVRLWFSALGIFSVLAVMRLRSEDAFLRKEFGETWEKWAEEVPFRLIPGLY